MDYLLAILIIVYVALMILVGYIAWKHTSNSEDYLVAGRQSNSYIMALSYGATFISTAAIVGFGGLAGTNGLGILWLVFLNIAVGIFIAFVIFGKPTRKMGQYLNALTFPEFLSKRFNSKFIQYFSGLLIFLTMPIYHWILCNLWWNKRSNLYRCLTRYNNVFRNAYITYKYLFNAWRSYPCT